MIKIVFLLFFVIYSFISSLTMTAQPTDNQTYHDVYIITDKQVATIGDQYLLDLPIRETEEKIVLFNQSAIPNELFWSAPFCYPNQKEITLIAPYIQVLPEGMICVETEEPIAQFNVFDIKRTHQEVTVDTHLIVNVNLLEMEPKEMSSTEMYYCFSESYGSSCCPPDPKWENAERPAQFLKNYETNHQLSLDNIQYRITGKEGEHSIFYGLNALDLQQRLAFILERMHSMVPNRHLKKYKRPPTLFTSTLAENWRVEVFEY